MREGFPRTDQSLSENNSMSSFLAEAKCAHTHSHVHTFIPCSTNEAVNENIFLQAQCINKAYSMLCILLYAESISSGRGLPIDLPCSIDQLNTQ